MSIQKERRVSWGALYQSLMPLGTAIQACTIKNKLFLAAHTYLGSNRTVIVPVILNRLCLP